MVVSEITVDMEMEIVLTTPVIVELASCSKERVIGLLLLLVFSEILLMQSVIIVI